MGQVRADACVRLGVPIRAVCDSDPQALRAMIERHPEVVVVADPADLDWRGVDALFVCVPPDGRAPAVQAIEAGVHVFFEKPVGVSQNAAQPIAAALDRNPVRNAVGYHNRHRGAVRRMREELMHDGVLGLSVVWTGGPYARSWWEDPQRSGGPFNEQGTHLVDLCRFLLGDVAEVHAVTLDGARAERAVAVALRTETGVCASLLYSCEATEKHVRVEAITTTGVRALSGWDLVGPDEAAPADRNEIFVTETAAFLNGGPILADFAEAMRTQAVVDAIRRSLREASGTQPTEVAR